MDTGSESRVRTIGQVDEGDDGHWRRKWSSNHQQRGRRKSFAKGVGQGEQRVRQVKLVVFTVLSFQLSHEAGLAEGKSELACTLHSCTAHTSVQALVTEPQRIRVVSS